VIGVCRDKLSALTACVSNIRLNDLVGVSAQLLFLRYHRPHPNFENMGP
jgi:hypothetical protein